MSNTLLRHWPMLQSGPADGSNSSATRWARQCLSRARTGNIARASSSRPIPVFDPFHRRAYSRRKISRSVRKESRTPTKKRACPTKWKFLANNTKIFEPSSFPFIFLFLFSLFTCPRRGSRVHSPRAFRNYPENGHGWPFLETGPVLDMHCRTSTR